MPVKNPRQTTEIILEALKRTGQRGILHAGWGGLGNLALPRNVFKVEYAPYDWLFPRMAMIFHHGGSGTTAYALRSGVPSCVIPFVFDQYYWGRQIAQLGVGLKPIPIKKLTTGNLQQAIEIGSHATHIRQSATELANKILAENGVRSTSKILETSQI